MTTTNHRRIHGKQERLRYVIATSVCVTLACLALLVGIVMLANTMPDTTGQVGSIVHCDTTSATYIDSVPSVTSFDPATCPITEPNSSKDSALKR